MVGASRGACLIDAIFFPRRQRIVIGGHAEIAPAPCPVFSEGQSIAAWRLILRATLGQGEQRRPDMPAGPSARETLAFAECVQYPIVHFGPVDPDPKLLFTISLDAGPGSLVFDLQMNPAVEEVVGTVLAVSRLEVGGAAFVQRYRLRRIAGATSS